jgi:type II secretory pathway pseudopilin PulG
MELMVVIVVISILVSITIPVARYVSRRAREASQQVMLAKIKAALLEYHAKYGEYPVTPATNEAGTVINYNDVLRHFPDGYRTYCYYTSNSLNTIFDMASSADLVEHLQLGDETCLVDYSLTYPLMLKQREGNELPLMLFPDYTIAYFVHRRYSGDLFPIHKKRRLKSGGFTEITLQAIYGNAINRPMAIDPVSLQQWKYSSPDGQTYSLTTNSF